MQEPRNHTPLHSAVYAVNIGIVRLLTGKGANKELRDIEGESPLDEANYLNRDGSHDEIIIYLNKNKSR